MAIIITKASVRRALEQWFIAARAGETMSARETAELSAHDAAAQTGDYFYQLLCEDEDSSQADAPPQLFAIDAVEEAEVDPAQLELPLDDPDQSASDEEFLA